MIKPTSAVVFALLGAISGTASVAGDDTAGEWLSRMMMAARDQSFSGAFVYSSGESLQSMRILHLVQGQGEVQRLYTLNGTPREVVRHDDHLVVHQPNGQKTHFIEPSHAAPFPMLSTREIADLEPYYELRLIDWNRVAERPCRGVALVPRDHLRYGHRLWLDQETGLLLRSQLFDEEGAVLEQLLFTEVRFGAEHPSLPAELNREDVPSGRLNRPSVTDVDQAWALSEPPSGFRRVSYLRHEGAEDQPTTDQLVLSDGLATVSVYIRPADSSGSETEGLTRMGATHAYSKTLDGHRIVVVGEVPAETATRIAEAVHLQSPSDD
jgi:sigma-E factor negative regulatory protein RseB